MKKTLLAALLPLCACFLAGESQAREYRQLEIINRCYDGGTVSAPGQREHVHFASRMLTSVFLWTGGMSAGKEFVFHKGRGELRVKAGDLFSGPATRELDFGQGVLRTWEYTLCPREPRLDDLQAATFREAAPGEKPDTYEMLFSQAPESAAPEFLYKHEAMAVSLNGQHLADLATDSRGILTIRLEPGATGQLGVESRLGDYVFTLGKDLIKVEARPTKGGEPILRPRQALTPPDEF